MINTTTKFWFNSIASDSFSPKVLNVTLNNDFYEQKLLGARKIVEDKIQGRDTPYLYDVDSEPLSFSLTIAFEDYATIDQVNAILKWLYLPKTYKPLKFEGMNATFFAIFIGEPKIYYVGNNNSGYKYIGYIVADVRCNAPYGYTDLITGTTNTGDLEVYPSFEIVNTSGASNSVVITNTSTSTTFTYQLDIGETLTFNGYSKILSSSLTSKNPYGTSWSKDYLTFAPGANNVQITATNVNGYTITWSYRAPKFL